MGYILPKKVKGQKKSKQGIETPKADIELIKSRLKLAQQNYKERYGSKKNKYGTESSGNVFADLGLPNPEELLAKAEITRQINKLIKQQNMTQKEAAELLGIDQY